MNPLFPGRQTMHRNLTTGQLEAWLAQYLWPFFRIGACFMVAPVFGAQFVPPRMRLFLAGAITFIVAPLVPPPAMSCRSRSQGCVVTIQQIIIGVAMGFALQLVFDALAMGGQLLSNSMGLGFAFNVDPLRGTSTPVLGQLYMLLVTLTFLALNGHLVLIEIARARFHDVARRHDRLRWPWHVEHRRCGALICSSAR